MSRCVVVVVVVVIKWKVRKKIFTILLNILNHVCLTNVWYAYVDTCHTYPQQLMILKLDIEGLTQYVLQLTLVYGWNFSIILISTLISGTRSIKMASVAQKTKSSNASSAAIAFTGFAKPKDLNRQLKSARVKMNLMLHKSIRLKDKFT